MKRKTVSRLLGWVGFAAMCSYVFQVRQALTGWTAVLASFAHIVLSMTGK